MREIDAAIEAAREAGEILREGWHQLHYSIQYKTPADPVTEYDHMAEETICRMLKSRFPSYGIVAEEGSQFNTDADAVWYIDPLDGTINFSHRYPIFAVSIGLLKKNELVVGVVLNPVSGEMYLAEKGSGATLDGKPIHISENDNLLTAIVASNFPLNISRDSEDNLSKWAAVVKRVMGIRCDGSAALDLCSVACGRFDAFWDHTLSRWDIAAGALIAMEAGAMISDFEGGKSFLERGEIIAASPAVFDPLTKIIRDTLNN
jgi:myo-inositol-1(or 4)-monophosphatase